MEAGSQAWRSLDQCLYVTSISCGWPVERCITPVRASRSWLEAAQEDAHDPRIGELAKLADRNPRTRRYDERLGQLKASRRADAGYRVYSAWDADLATF